MAATMARYLDQIVLSLRPSSVAAAERVCFAGYLTVNHPEVAGVADVERTHIEGFKA